MFIIALTVAQALLALKGHTAGRARLAARRRRRSSAVTAAVAPVTELEMQVELGFLAGAAVSTLVMGGACSAA